VAWPRLLAGIWNRPGNFNKETNPVLIIIGAFIASAFSTALVRFYLIRRNVLDIPNRRSSHSVPTPVGGGLGIVLVFLATVPWLVHTGTLAGSLAWALTGGGLAVALVGFLDDDLGVPARLRLLVHFAAAGWALWQLNGVGPLHLGWTVWNWSWIGQFLALIGLVWMINLYNFMDGIDGLAGMEAFCVSGLSSPLLAWSGLAGLSQASLLLAAASAGFLLLNWPPARVFMGDAGSGFLGFVFGVLVISSAKEQPWLLWSWLILLSVFIVDSFVTLARRWITGARWYEAHCTHAYQHAARHRSHSTVTLTVAVVNVVWLFPLGWAASVWHAFGPLFFAVAAAPLVWTAYRYQAGQDSAPTADKTSAAEMIDPVAPPRALEMPPR
jgi:Fuc2NAc and GlcNAc transferase